MSKYDKRTCELLALVVVCGIAALIGVGILSMLPY